LTILTSSPEGFTHSPGKGRPGKGHSQADTWVRIRTGPRRSKARATRRAVRLRAERQSLRERARSVAWRQSKDDGVDLTPSCESDQPGIVVVAHPGDLVAHIVSTFLRDDGIPVWDVNPHQLGDLRYEIRRDALYLQECPISGAMLRWSCCPDEGLTSSQHCGDPLVIASWLAAADLGQTRIVNSYDAESWRGGAGWAVWEHRLSESGVPTLKSDRGSQTFGRARTSVMACGEVIDGPRSQSVIAACGVLMASRMRLATISSLANGVITNVDTQPDIVSSSVARLVATAIIDHMTGPAAMQPAGSLLADPLMSLVAHEPARIGCSGLSDTVDLPPLVQIREFPSARGKARGSGRRLVLEEVCSRPRPRSHGAEIWGRAGGRCQTFARLR